MIELGVVVAVIAFLAAMVAPMASVQINNKKSRATKEEMKNLKTALLMYYSDVYETNVGHQFPDTGHLEYLENNPFVSGHECEDRWNGPYINKIFKEYTQDEWNTNYSYIAAGSSCTIISAGPDRTTGSGDDITITISGRWVSREKKMRVQKELMVIKRAVQKYTIDRYNAGYTNKHLGQADSVFPIGFNVNTLYPGYLSDESYRTDEWGSDYTRYSGSLGGVHFYLFQSNGPNLIDDAGLPDDIRAE